MTDPKEPRSADPASAERLTAFLGDPASYPHTVESVDVIQTHISWVALAGDFVYKVKKPVDFGFVDYSTLEKRRHFAEREIALNSRLCSKIYLDVVPIACEHGELKFVSPDVRDGEVECAVRMRRLDKRAGQPAVISDARAEDFATLSAAYETPTTTEETDVLPGDAGGPLASTLHETCRRLVERRVGTDTTCGER